MKRATEARRRCLRVSAGPFFFEPRAAEPCATMFGEAEEFLAAGVTLPGSEAELPARARVAEARGDSDGAIRALRDEKDADSRSVLISMIARHKGDAAALDWFRGTISFAQSSYAEWRFDAVPNSPASAKLRLGQADPLRLGRSATCASVLISCSSGESCALPWSFRGPNKAWR